MNNASPFTASSSPARESPAGRARRALASGRRLLVGPCSLRRPMRQVACPRSPLPRRSQVGFRRQLLRQALRSAWNRRIPRRFQASRIDS